MSRIEVAGEISLRRARPTKGCKTDYDDSGDWDDDDDEDDEGYEDVE
jgi:hypothetical protein